MLRAIITFYLSLIAIQKNGGGNLDEICIKSPDEIINYPYTSVFITSEAYSSEIKKSLYDKGIMNVYIPQVNVRHCLNPDVHKELNSRTIDLGTFFNKTGEESLKELTFMPGGSGILDYLFIKTVGEAIHAKRYLEIGTYIGESINVMTDVCEELISITAPIDAPYSMKAFCESMGVPDYSDRLTYNSKIKHIYYDSKKYDFASLPKDIDLFFIDGDHSYEGVLSDTRNIFGIRNENSVVIWHDFYFADGFENAEVINAVHDALGSEFDNVYVTDKNMCGIYLPDKYKELFTLTDQKYSDSQKLYVYDCNIKMSVR